MLVSHSHIFLYIMPVFLPFLPFLVQFSGCNLAILSLWWNKQIITCRSVTAISNKHCYALHLRNWEPIWWPHKLLRWVLHFVVFAASWDTTTTICLHFWLFFWVDIQVNDQGKVSNKFNYTWVHKLTHTS